MKFTVRNLLEITKNGRSITSASRQEIINYLQSRKFNLLYVEDGKAKDIGDSIKSWGNGLITVFVVN